MNRYPDYAFPKLAKLPSGKKRHRVAFLVSPNPDPLEWIGPMNVLRMADFVFQNSGHDDYGYDVEIVSSEPGAVYDLNGIEIRVDKPFHRLRGEVDTLLVAPMNWEDLFDRDDTLFAWLRRMAGRTRRIGSICSAAYVLAEAGLFDGGRATTHWDLVEDFRERYPNVEIEGEPIYVKDGNVYSSAGMSAGIDMTVAIIEEDFGREVALRVAQALVLFMKRPGNQAQFSVQLMSRLPEQSSIAELQSYIVDHIDEDLRVDVLAEKVGMSPRNFSRVFSKEIGMAPGTYVERCRIESARRHLEQSRAPLAEVSTNCGYGSADAMRIAFERHLNVTPSAYRERFSTAKAS